MNAGAAVELCSGYGAFHSDGGKRPRPLVAVTLEAIERMLADPPSVEKMDAQWVIPSNLRTRVHAEQREKGRFYSLWADIDWKETPPTDWLSFDQVIDRVTPLLPDFWAYSSSGSTEEKQKLRLLIPMSEPIDGRTFCQMQKILNDLLERHGIEPDRASERAGQVCYLPNRGKYYRHFTRNNGGHLHKDMWSEDLQAEEEREKAAEKARIERMEQAREKASRRIETGCKSPIDAYVAEFPIDMMLDAYGYQRRGNRWLSPNSGSKTPGVSLTTDGRKWLSTHGSDAHIGTPTSNGTMGDAFDLFVHYEHNGDRTAAVRAAAEMFGLRSERQQRQGDPPPWTYEVPPVDDYDFGDGGRPVVDQQKPQPRFKSYSLLEISTMPVDFNPLINGILGPREGWIIAAEAGVGKSLLADFLALHLGSPAHGGLWGKFTIPEPKTVLIVQSENGLAARKQRLNILFSAYPNLKQGARHVFHMATADDIRVAGNLCSRAFQDDVGEFIEKHHADVVVFDPLISYHEAEENDNVAMRNVLDHLQIGILDRFNVSTIIPHHFNRNGGMRGASAIRDWAANVWLITVEKVNQDGSKTIKITNDKSRNFPQFPSFYVERTRSLGFDLCTPPISKDDDRIEAAVEVLKEHNGLIEKNDKFKALLMKKLNVSKTTANRIIDNALLTKNILIRQKEGRGCPVEYYLSDDVQCH